MHLRLPAAVAGGLLLALTAQAGPADAAPRGLRVQDVTSSRTQAKAGDSLTVKGRVRNAGAKRRTGTVRLQLRSGSTTRSLGSVRVLRLKAGRSVRFAKVVRLGGGLPAGSYKVRACLGGTCRIASRALVVKAGAAAPPTAPPTTGDTVPPVTNPPATSFPPATPPQPAPTGPTGPGGPPKIDVQDGVTQPVFGFADAIRQRVWVPIPYDTDGDGTYDRVAVDIKRPAATAKGLKVPIVMDASPYYSTVCRGNETECKRLGSDGLVDKWPLFLDNYFVPRGYAVALVDTVGTDASTGCPVVGGDADIQGIKRVIDWLNGRATAYSSVSGGDPISADWTTGAVGMIGKSYDGTHANGVAATGVDGLKTIVPVAGISSWYNYYNINGLRFSAGSGAAGLSNTVTNPERRAQCAAARQAITTQSGAGALVSPTNQGGVNPNDAGNFNAYWDERNYVADADKVKASVLLVHGVNDDNVKPNNYGDWWNALAANDVPRKIWLSEMGHVDPFDYDRDEWVDTLHRWMDHWLQGVDNGIMDEPMAHIERQPTGTTGSPDATVYDEFSTWPDAGAQPTQLFLQPAQTGATGATGTSGAAVLSTTRYTPPPTGTSGATGSTGTSGATGATGTTTPSFSDLSTQTETTAIRDPDSLANPNRITWTSPVLTKDVRMSGQSSLQVQATVDQTDTSLSALLVDYSASPFLKINTGVGDGVTTDRTQEDCVGLSEPQEDGDDACYFRVRRNYTTTTSDIVAKGTIDARNRDSLRFKTDLTPGAATWFTIPIWADDHVFKAGHRIGVVLLGSDRSYSSVPKTNGAKVTVRIGDSRLTLPVVGGKAALGF